MNVDFQTVVQNMSVRIGAAHAEAAQLQALVDALQKRVTELEAENEKLRSPTADPAP